MQQCILASSGAPPPQRIAVVVKHYRWSTKSPKIGGVPSADQPRRTTPLFTPPVAWA